MSNHHIATRERTMPVVLGILGYAALSALAVAWILIGPFAYVGDMPTAAASGAEAVAFLAPSLAFKAGAVATYFKGTR